MSEPQFAGTIFDTPRYRTKPMLLLFEYFVLDTTGNLSDEKRAGAQQLDLKTILKTQADDWVSAVRESLQLSPTIETAILDSWREACESGSEQLDSEAFSKEFADRYFADNSTVDVWLPQELEEAQQRVLAWQQKR